MFGQIFQEGYANKAKQDALDTYRASLAYQVARRDNPKMLEQTVDFSNPESVARMQYQIANPYGYNNPYANPNLLAQNYGYTPYQYNAPVYGGTWYGGWGNNDNARYMVPPGQTPAKVSTGDPQPICEMSLEQKLNTPPKVKVVSGAPDIGKESPKVDKPFKIVKKELYHEEHTPYTIQELDPDYNQLKTIPDTPLNWNAADEQELDKLSEDLAIYDKAMAHCAYNIPTLNGVTREDYNYFKRYFYGVLQDFKTKEILNNQLDYRAKYRYRRLPPLIEDDDGSLVPDQSRPVPIPIRTISLGGEIEYDYDRGRDELTQEEWDIFVDRAYVDMIDGAERIKAADIIAMNQQPAQQKKTEDQDKYNPYDPIAVKLHNIKIAQKSYNTNKDFYRHVFRHKLTDEEFDNWWYGLDSSRPAQKPGQPYDQAAAHNAWANQMTLRNLVSLNSFKPIDPVARQNWANQIMAKALNYYTNGSVKRDMSLAEYFKNLSYLNSRIHEMNLIEQRRQQNQNMWNEMSKNTYRNSLYSFANPSAQSYFNPNPNYSSQWGTIDPRLGNPQQVVDLTNNPLAQEKKNRFLQHCANTQGTVPLSPVYR